MVMKRPAVSMVLERLDADPQHGLGDATGARSGPLAKMRGMTAHILRPVPSSVLLPSGVARGNRSLVCCWHRPHALYPHPRPPHISAGAAKTNVCRPGSGYLNSSRPSGTHHLNQYEPKNGSDARLATRTV